jgi:glutamate-1-semialdehyde 2,1-aminomutase
MSEFIKAVSFFMEKSPEMRDLIIKYLEKTPNSLKIFERAAKKIPGGVETPVRYFFPHPLYIANSGGSRLTDVDGNEYIDYCLSYGPLITGHAHPKIIEAVQAQVKKGSLYGFPHEDMVELADEITKRYPFAEMLRFSCSGSEAIQHAVKLARAYTNKDKILKMEGCFHGCIDYLFCSIHTPKGQEGPYWAPSVVPESLGIPESALADTIVAPFNDIESIEKILNKNEGEVAAVLLEPIIGSLGVIPPKGRFLEDLRKLTEEHNVLLIFDEVKTGCRVAYGGAPELYKVNPDIIVLGKVIGGGYPLSAFASRAELMNLISPMGEVWHMGTYNANPVSIAAGLACLKDVMKKPQYNYLDKISSSLFKGLQEIGQDAKVPIQTEWIGSFGCLRFTDKKVTNYREFEETLNEEFYDIFWRKMLLEGVIISGPHAVNNITLSIAHTNQDIERTLEVAKITFELLKKISR